MKIRSMCLSLMTLALTSCHTADVATRIVQGVDWDNRPLPSDRKHLTIQGPSAAVHFTVPHGWQIASQPVFNRMRYELTHTGTFGNLPFLRVELETGPSGNLTAEGSHAAHLEDVHTNFPEAYRHPVGTVALSDGRTVVIEEYLRGDVPELVAFVAERDAVTGFFLLAETAEGIQRERKAFEQLLQSYHTR